MHDPSLLLAAAGFLLLLGASCGRAAATHDGNRRAAVALLVVGFLGLGLASATRRDRVLTTQMWLARAVDGANYATDALRWHDMTPAQRWSFRARAFTVTTGLLTIGAAPTMLLAARRRRATAAEEARVV